MSVFKEAGILVQDPKEQALVEEFLTAFASGDVTKLLEANGIKAGGLNPAQIIAIAKMVCSVMSVVCPIVQNL